MARIENLRAQAQSIIRKNRDDKNYKKQIRQCKRKATKAQEEQSVGDSYHLLIKSLVKLRRN